MKDNQTKYPQLRFNGFTDPWEQRKLGEVADIIGGGTPSTNVSEYWNGDIDWYSPVEIGNQIYIDESQKKITELGLQKSSAHILPVGTVLFTSRAGIGNTAILAKEGCTNQGFQSIVPYKDLLNSYFIFSRTSELKRYGEINGAGSTFIEVSGKQMAKMPISVPSIEEQQKIGTFFKQLDDTITLHQRKLAKLKELKQGYLQKLFPRNGSKFPQLRFAGFADAWEQRKLGDIFSERNERANSGQYKMLSITVDSGIVPADSLDRKDNSSSDKSHYKRVFEGDIAYNSMRMWQGASGVSEMNGIVSPAYTVLKPSKQTDTKFISYLFKLTPMLQSFQKNSQGLTSDTWNLKYKQFSPIKVKIPILNEQMKIGKVLEMLDDSIAANQRKLEKLQELKKGYL